MSYLYSFTGGTDGTFPVNAPLDGGDGYLYGTALYGGVGTQDPWGGFGLVYRIKPDGSGIQTLYPFGGGADGGFPASPLIKALDGSYYGTTEGGEGLGAPSGTVFRIAAGKLSTLYTFKGSDGRFPTGALLQGADGMLYGTTQAGGSSDNGTVFKLKPDGSGYTVLHHFSGGSDGRNPVAGLSFGADGKLYGAASYGGDSSEGTAFSLATDGSGFGVIHTFTGGADGANPYSPLVPGGDGYFYGTTNEGGAACQCGTVYKMDTQGSVTTLHTFSGGTDGSNPRELIVLKDGAIYGTTQNGGASGAGSAFKVGSAGGMLGTLALEPGKGGAMGFTLAANGLLYSPSPLGGSSSLGLLFSVDPALAFVAPNPPSTTMTASKTVLEGADFAVLTWSSTAADACSAAGDGSFNGSAPTSGTRKVAPATRGAHVYSMTCSGAGGSATASVTLIKRK